MESEAGFVLSSNGSPQEFIELYFSDEQLTRPDELHLPNDDQNETSHFKIVDNITLENWIVDLPDGGHKIFYIQNTEDLRTDLGEFITFQNKETTGNNGSEFSATLEPDNQLVQLVDFENKEQSVNDGTESSLISKTDEQLVEFVDFENQKKSVGDGIELSRISEPDKRLEEYINFENDEKSVSDCTESISKTDKQLVELSDGNSSECSSLPEEQQIEIDKSPTAGRLFDWACTFCSERCATRNSLTTHMKQHCNLFCIRCLKTVTTLNRLNKHKRMLHGIGDECNVKTRANKAIKVTSKYGRSRLVFNTLTLLNRDLE